MLVYGFIRIYIRNSVTTHSTYVHVIALRLLIWNALQWGVPLRFGWARHYIFIHYNYFKISLFFSFFNTNSAPTCSIYVWLRWLSFGVKTWLQIFFKRSNYLFSVVLYFLCSDICAKQRVSLNPQTYYYLLSAPWLLDCRKLR